MTVTIGAYNPANNTLPITVTGGGTGELVLFEAQAPGSFTLQRIVARIPGYTGGPTVITDYFPADGSRTYSAFVDDVANGTATASISITGEWIISLSDPATTLQVCAPRDGRESWRSRRRRGWWGNVVGQVRAVAVTDVAMGSREGRWTVLVTPDQTNNMDNLLKQGIVCFRGPEPRNGLFAMILDHTDRPAGDGSAWWTFDITWAQVDPAGFLGTVPS